jgi:Transmembrane secretion effector
MGPHPSLSPNRLTVSLVQVANSLPMFLFALPAGFLADIVDKRRFLIGSEIALTVVSAMIAVLVSLDSVNPSNPPGVHVPPRRRFGLYRPGMAVGRASTCPEAGPGRSGGQQRHRRQYQQSGRTGAGWRRHRRLVTAAPFWINALSNFAVIGAMLWWRPTPQGRNLLHQTLLMTSPSHTSGSTSLSPGTHRPTRPLWDRISRGRAVDRILGQRRQTNGQPEVSNAQIAVIAKRRGSRHVAFAQIAVKHGPVANGQSDPLLPMEIATVNAWKARKRSSAEHVAYPPTALR